MIVRFGTQAAMKLAKRIAKKGRGLTTGPVKKPKAKAKKAVGKQNKIAKQSAPFDKIDSGDFKKLRAKAKKMPIKTKASKKRNSVGNKLKRAVNKLKKR